MKKLIVGAVLLGAMLMSGASAQAEGWCGYGDGYSYGYGYGYGYYPHGGYGSHTYRYDAMSDFWGSFEGGPGYHASGYASPYQHNVHHGYHYNPEHGWHSGAHYGHN